MKVIVVDESKDKAREEEKKEGKEEEERKVLEENEGILKPRIIRTKIER